MIDGVMISTKKQKGDGGIMSTRKLFNKLLIFWKKTKGIEPNIERIKNRQNYSKQQRDELMVESFRHQDL